MIWYFTSWFFSSLMYERLVVRTNQFDLELAVGAVHLGIGGLVGDGVLVANRLRDFLEDSGQVALKAR